MTGMKLQTHEQMLFALLRMSLQGREVETEFFRQSSADDWKECYLLASRQGVMALAWDGVLRLPTELMPPKALKITWGMAVEAYEKQYERYCSTIDDLSARYASRGIRTVQLKGVGLSAYYPIPSHREGGDIDIYTYSADVGMMMDKEANTLADRLMEEQGIEVDMHSLKHSKFYYKGIPVENHKAFLNVEKYRQAIEAERKLKRLLNPQDTVLMDGKYHCMTPSLEFNLLFVAFHAAQHYGAGLALHHLCDWAVLLNRWAQPLPPTCLLDDRSFNQAVAALSCLCNRYLGASIPLDEEPDWVDEMLESILYPKFVIGYVPVKGKLNILSYKLRRFMYIHRLNNQVLDWPMWKHVWESVVNYLREPETIFHTKVK